MLMSIEGPDIPDIRAGTTKEQNDMDELLNAAYSCRRRRDNKYLHLWAFRGSEQS